MHENSYSLPNKSATSLKIMDIGACTERTMRARDDVYKVPLKAPEAELAASGLSKVREAIYPLVDLAITQIFNSISSLMIGVIFAAVRSLSSANQ